MGSGKSKGRITSSKSSDEKDELNRTVLKINDKYKIFPIKLQQSSEKNNENQLISKDIIMELAMNYLEIREMYQLALTCKVLYSIIFSDVNEFWRRVGERDGFVGKSGIECKEIYSNLWNKCSTFENDRGYSNCLESRIFTYGNMVSNNYSNFIDFLDGINHDFNQMIYVLRNEKRNIILRAYIAVYGLIDHRDDDQETDQETDTEIMNERLEKIFRILCLKENGEHFDNIIAWQERKVCNLLSITMDMNLEKLTPESKQRVEDLFLNTAAFRVDCSAFTKYYRFAEGQFVKRAYSILCKKFESRESNASWNKCYNLLKTVLTDPEMCKNVASNDCLDSMIRYFQSFHNEESNDIIIDLLRNKEIVNDKSISRITCGSITWYHPSIFTELLNERYYSDDCKRVYLNVIGNYICSEQTIDLEIRKKALNLVSFICKNKFNEDEFADAFHYYLPWINLKKVNKFPYPEFKKEALAELKECTYFMWTHTKNVTFLPIIREFYLEDKVRTINQLLDLKPLSLLTKENNIHIVEEAFKVLKDYGMGIQSSEYESFFPRMISFMEAYLTNPQYHCNDCIVKQIVQAAEWIHPKYSIEKLKNTMIEESDKSSFIQYYIKDALPIIEALTD